MTAPLNLLLLVYDSVRADSVSLHRTPTLCRLAEHGTHYPSAWSSAPWTSPATSALLTGLYPHRIANAFRWSDHFAEGRETLFHRFAAAGYRIASFVFDPDYLFRGLPQAGVMGRADDLPALHDWLARDTSTPFLVYLHSWTTHVPYGLDPDSIRGRERNLHQEAVGRASESEIAPLLARLDNLGLLERTLVVFTADHGEDWTALESPGPVPWGAFDLHGRTLSEEVLRVPLILVDPTRRGETRVHPGRVRTIDLVPTLLTRIGLEPLPDLDGIPLPDQDEPDRTVLAMTNATEGSPETWPARPTRWTYLEDHFQWTGDPTTGLSTLLDLSRPVAERVDLSTVYPLRARSMRTTVLNERVRTVSLPLDDPTDQVARRLRGLGYL